MLPLILLSCRSIIYYIFNCIYSSFSHDIPYFIIVVCCKLEQKFSELSLVADRYRHARASRFTIWILNFWREPNAELQRTSLWISWRYKKLVLFVRWEYCDSNRFPIVEHEQHRKHLILPFNSFSIARTRKHSETILNPTVQRKKSLE